MILVTHYQRLLNYIVPDFVHVLADGRIVKSGGKELALELEETVTPEWRLADAALKWPRRPVLSPISSACSTAVPELAR